MRSAKLKDLLGRLRHKVENEYNVSFKTFAILYVVSFVPFYIGIIMAAQGALKKSAYLIVLGLIINRFAWAMPYLYPYFRGTLPQKIRTGILVWVALGVVYGIVSFVWN